MKRPSALIGQVDHLPTRVANYLTQEIRSGRLLSGGRLLPETTLAEDLGVSRNVVREAIAQLRADGVLHVRQGSGAYVLPPENSNVIRLDPVALTDTKELRQLFELREILETEAARLAATRFDAEGLARLHAALRRMQGVEKTGPDSVSADLDFHREIARATGNSFILTFVGYIAKQIRDSIYIARRSAPVLEVVGPTITEHVEIYEAMVAHDSDRARAAMQNHIRQSGIRACGDASVIRK